MTTTPSGSVGRAVDRVLGRDTPNDVMHVVGLFALFGLLESLTRRLARVPAGRLTGSVLLQAAAVSHPVSVAVLVGAGAVAGWRRRDRLWSPWRAMDHGQVLRALACPLVVMMTWNGSLYDFNYFLGRWHAADRVLLACLAVGCVLRPVFLLPFVIESRVIASQFDVPFHTTAGQNIDALLLIALVAIAATHLWFVATGRRRSAPLILVLTAAIATFFFVPGKGKLALDWVSNTDLANLPLSAHTAGWGGQGDGGWALHLSDILRTFNRPLLFGMQLFELASVVVVAHYRAFRLWLPICIVFHITMFAITGFWFASWVVLEATLLIVLTRPRLEPWLAENATPIRALIAMAAVAVGGSALFHPPGLAWLDAPVSFGYRIEAVEASGKRVHVPVSALAPYEQELTFNRLRLGPKEPLTAGYGAVVSASYAAELATIETFADLAAHQAASDPQQVRRSEDFMRRFFDHLSAGQGSPWWSIFGPPDHFWTGSPPPTLDSDEPIQRLDVYVLTAMHHDDAPETRRELVFTIVRRDDGTVEIVTPPPAD